MPHNMRDIRRIMAPDVGHRYILSFFLLRHVTWAMSYYVFVPLQIKPNAITILSMAAGVLAALCAVSGAFVWAGVLMILWAALDCCDGEVARYTDRMSTMGSVLEKVNSDIQYVLWLPSIAAGLYMMNHIPFIGVFLAFVGAGGFSALRGFCSRYPRDLAGDPDTSFKKFVACQFKDGVSVRAEYPLGKHVFIMWRNVLTQFGLFEILFLAAAIAYQCFLVADPLVWFTYLYAAGFLAFNGIILLALMMAGLLK